MDLIKLERNLPLRAYPKKDLEDILYNDFFPWLSDLLSLTNEESAKRLNISLPAIKSQCIGMGFNEIKKMFEMYADFKLSIKPIPNYFDRILFGKIVNEYKQQKPKLKTMDKPKIPTKEEQEESMNNEITRLFLEFENTYTISGASSHIYNYLDSQGKLQGNRSLEEWNKYKREVFDKAKKLIKSEKSNEAMKDLSIRRGLNVIMSKIEDGTFDGLVTISKKIVLIDYFKSLQDD